jgi:hypothetical protein
MSQDALPESNGKVLSPNTPSRWHCREEGVDDPDEPEAALQRAWVLAQQRVSIMMPGAIE